VEGRLFGWLRAISDVSTFDHTHPPTLSRKFIAARIEADKYQVKELFVGCMLMWFRR
jgi:hypothetical protein